MRYAVALILLLRCLVGSQVCGQAPDPSKNSAGRTETQLERRIEFRGPDGNPAVPLKLELYLPDGPLLWRGHPDSTSLTLHLAPGEYIAVVEGSPGVEFRHDLTIAEEEEPKPILLSVP